MLPTSEGLKTAPSASRLTCSRPWLLGCALPGGEIVPPWSAASSTASSQQPTSDRRFGAQDVAKNYMSSHHQATEYFEIMFNKGKFDARLPSTGDLQYGAEGPPPPMSGRDGLLLEGLQELISKDRSSRTHTQGCVRARSRPGRLIAQLEKTPHEEVMGPRRMGAACRVLQHDNARITRRLRASFPGVLKIDAR